MAQPEWHCLESDEILKQLDASVEGLTTGEATRRLGQYGPNSTLDTRHRGLLAMLAGQFADFTIIVLLAAALISGFIGEPQDTIAILVICLLLSSLVLFAVEFEKWLVRKGLIYSGD